MSKFIVIEGLDGAGTTTQAARLVDWLQVMGSPVIATREPTGGPLGRVLRTTLRAEPGAPAEAALPWMFAADRADHLHRTVLPALEAGQWVVSDRYLHSSLAYQSLSIGLEEVWALNHTFQAPDLTLFLRVPVDLCLKRIGDRPVREIFEEKSRLDAISGSYDRVISFLREKGQVIEEIDGTKSPTEVFEEILGPVGALMVHEARANALRR